MFRRKTTMRICSISSMCLGVALAMSSLAFAKTPAVAAGAGGITGITKGKADLTVPPETPPGEVWRYGLGFPFQVGPRMAGLFCNIRKEGTGSIDFEIGTDLILFDELSKIGAAKPIPLSQYEKGVHPDFGKTITRKGPVVGGFVPFGAKQADGSPHPYAGSGFGLCWAIVHGVGKDERFDYLNTQKTYFEFLQFAYDGKDFRVLGKEAVERKDLLPNSEWMIMGGFFSNAVPDGRDLLYTAVAKKEGVDFAAAGVTRWRHGAKGWRPISFTPLPGQKPNVTWGEPSLIRDVDGSLLMSARSTCGRGSKIAFDLAVWRSTDNGKSWKQAVYRRRCRSRSPVSVNRAADGTAFVVANFPPLMRRRDILCYWPLNAARTDLGELRIARDVRGEFGPAPSGSWWRIDHPASAVVRLADGAWHGLLVYRIVDNGEIEGNAHPTPQTGCYVEEVFSSGPAIEAWRF